MMTVAEGELIPDVELRIKTADGVDKVRSRDVLGKGKVVLFAVPGAFTPTCSDYHLPGFVMRAEELKAKGVDTIACISVNDAFVMGAWGRDRNVGSSVVMVADGNGVFTESGGLGMDGSAFGLGQRSRRYALVID